MLATKRQMEAQFYLFLVNYQIIRVIIGSYSQNVFGEHKKMEIVESREEMGQASDRNA